MLNAFQNRQVPGERNCTMQNNTHAENVDPSEISKFERIASRWWDAEGEFKPLHDINPLRANYIDLRAPVAEQKVLDVGCGGDLTPPGGHLFFSTINRTPKAYAFAVLGAEYLLKLLPKGTHEYKKFIQPSELALWIREAGLVLEDVSGMTYNPLTKSYRLSENDVSVNYLIHATKPK